MILHQKSMRLAVSLSIAFVLGGSLIVPGYAKTYQTGTTMIREFRQADGLLQTGQYEAAEAKYMALLKKNPNSPQARSALALAQAELYKLDAAEKNAKQVLEKNPNNAFAHIALGAAFRNRIASLDMYYKARRDELLSSSEYELQRAISLDSRLPEAYNQLGETYRFQGRYADALAAFKHATQLDPNFSEALVNQGIIRQETGDLAGARATFETALKKNSKNYLAHYRLGENYLRQGDSHKAITSLNTASSLNRSNAAIMNKLAEAYESQGNVPAAIANYKKAMQTNPAFMPAYVGLSNLYDYRGDGELAMSELKSALNNNPKYNPARNQLGRLALNVDKPDQAIQYYKESLQQNGQDPEALQGLSQALMIVAQKTASGVQTSGNEADLATAEQALQEAIQLNPNDLRLHLAALRINQLNGNVSVSQSELQRIVSTPAQNNTERLIRTEAYQAMGQYPQADTILSGLFQSAKNDPEQLLIIGDTMKANGDLVKAREAYTMAQTADPQSIKARRAVQNIDAAEANAEKSLRLAKALNNWRQKESSIDYYEESLSRHSRQPEARLALAKLYEKYHQYDKAALSYQHYLGLEPNLSEKDRQGYTRKIEKLQGMTGQNYARN